jgi:hypothetical protein
LLCVVTSPHYDGTNTGTSAGLTEWHSRKDGLKSKGNERRNEKQLSRGGCLAISTKVWRKERTACQDGSEAYLEKAETNPEKTKAGLEEMVAAADVLEERLNKMARRIWRPSSESEHLEVPREEAAVKTIGELVDRYGDRHLAVRHRPQKEKWTQADSGSRQKLAAARGRLTDVPLLHGVKAAVIKDRRSRRDDGRVRNATAA